MEIKLGNLDISYFKVGGADCSIYLGSVKLYPQEAPVADKYLTFVANGDAKFKLSGNSVSYSLDSGVTFYKRSTQLFASGANGIKTGWTRVNDDTTQPT